MKKINIVLFGVGNVGSTFISQILSAEQQFAKGGLEINIPVIANSRSVLIRKRSIGTSWKEDLLTFGVPHDLDLIFQHVREREYENLVAIDATASDSFVQNYPLLVRKGFHIIAANKVANTLSSEFYSELRETLKEHQKLFFYETNVGAGLPIIETLNSLHRSGERIRKVRGVFSGSMSYIFNTFSSEDRPFSSVLAEAQAKGFTEPDPRTDLSGKDVARKLLILARELSLKKELSEIRIQDLVPRHLNGGSTIEEFLWNQQDLDPEFRELKENLKEDEVIRHVGELDLASQALEVKLVTEKKASALGSLTNADSSFEIYTESYGEEPLVIRGAGAGASVTARGLVADVIKLSERIF